MHIRSRSTATRGAALVTTVLLTIIGATIALLSLWVAIARTRVAAAERDLAVAQSALLSAMAEYEAKLSDNPYYFLEWVDRYERARLCTGASTPRLVDPGRPWPSECGAFWTYVDPQSSDLPDRPEPARIVVTPPSTTQPYLTVRAVAAAGTATLARERTYSLSSASTFAVYSEDDIRLDSLFRDPETALTISGDMYTSEFLYLPSLENTTIEDALIMAEKGFLPTGGVEASQTRRFFCAWATDGSDPESAPDGEPDPCPIEELGLEDIRLLEPAPLKVSALYDDIAQLEALACAMTNPSGEQPNPSTLGLADHICMRPGQKVTDRLNFTWTVPDDAATFLVIPTVDVDGDDPDAEPRQLIDIWATSKSPSFVQDCLIQCSLPGLAAPEVAANAHMGASDFWTAELENDVKYMGSFYAPHSGVLFFDGDVLIGFCDRAFLNAHSECSITDLVNSGDIGISASLTLLAGTRQSPANIYISGSLPVYLGDGTLQEASGRLGLVATRHLFIPYWARTPGGDLQIDASLLALGIDADYGSGRFRGAISSLPASVHPDSLGTPTNQGQTLTVTGSVAGQAVDLSTNQFHEVVLRADPRLLSDAPPYYPSFRGQWNLRTVTDLSPADVCGALTCPSWTDNTPPAQPEDED